YLQVVHPRPPLARAGIVGNAAVRPDSPHRHDARNTEVHTPSNRTATAVTSHQNAVVETVLELVALDLLPFQHRSLARQALLQSIRQLQRRHDLEVSDEFGTLGTPK